MWKETVAFDYNGNLIIKYKWGINDHGQMHIVTGNSPLNCFYAVLFKMFLDTLSFQTAMFCLEKHDLHVEHVP